VIEKKNIRVNSPDLSDKRRGSCWGISTDFHFQDYFFTEIPESQYFLINI